jgi:hypothetical protein
VQYLELTLATLMLYTYTMHIFFRTVDYVAEAIHVDTVLYVHYIILYATYYTLGFVLNI